MKYAITFVLGAAAGSLVTWKVIENKYKKLADEEIASVVERYKNRNAKVEKEANEKTEEAPKVVKENKEKEVEGYKTILQDMDYTPDNDYTVYTEPLKEVIYPFVISPDDLGDMPGYDVKQGWTYYADFVLTDENDEVVTDPDSIIGDALSHFGEFVDDAVFVRNDELKCDYEIIKIDKTYDEIFN